MINEMIDNKVEWFGGRGGATHKSKNKVTVVKTTQKILPKEIVMGGNVTRLLVLEKRNT